MEAGSCPSSRDDGGSIVGDASAAAAVRIQSGQKFTIVPHQQAYLPGNFVENSSCSSGWIQRRIVRSTMPASIIATSEGVPPAEVRSASKSSLAELSTINTFEALR